MKPTPKKLNTRYIKIKYPIMEGNKVYANITLTSRFTRNVKLYCLIARITVFFRANPDRAIEWVKARVEGMLTWRELNNA